MAEPKNAAAHVTYVQFVHPVSIGGDYGGILNWSRDKHGKTLTMDLGPSWVTLRWKDQVRRVPMTNVAFISEISS